MTRVAPSLVLMGLALGCSRPTSGTTPASSTAASSASAPQAKCGNWGPPPNADVLCDQHDLGTTAEIQWTSYGSTDDRDAVDARYRELAARCHAVVVAEGGDFTIENGPTHVSTHAVSPVAYPTCEKKPAPAHKTIIVVSTRFARH